MRRFVLWYKNNVSATVSISIVTFFFTSAIALLAIIYNQYNVQQIENLYEKRSNEVDSILSNKQKEVYKLTKIVSFKTLNDSIEDKNSKQIDLITRAISYYRKKNKKADSLNYYKSKLNNLVYGIPIDIGRLQAYSGIDLEERTSEYELSLKFLNNQYQLSKSLEKYFRTRTKNEQIENQINDFVINSSTKYQYYKDTLNSRPPNIIINKGQASETKFKKNVEYFKFNQRLYLILCTIFFILAFSLSYIAYLCGHFKKD